MSPRATIRIATEADISAIISLLLTSFRQFELFSFLYSPLNTNRDAAHDTIWVWKRRLLIGLLDPRTSIVVAEMDETVPPTLSRPEQLDGESGADESWRMLDWLTIQGKLSQNSKDVPGKLIVGFAIWIDREGEEDDKRTANALQPKWGARMRTLVIQWEIWFWNQFWQRKDQKLDAYAAYITSEGQLGQEFYSRPSYYLENACVDFRYQRLGIGRILVEWGIEQARGKGLPAQTESGSMGLGLYLKLGFKQIGTWRVPTTNDEQEYLEFPVLKLLFD